MLTIAEVNEFATIEPICLSYPDDNQDAVPNSHENPIQVPPEQPTANVSPSINHTAEPDAEPELEPEREPDIFDNEEEYVGVGDEEMYMPVPQPPDEHTQTAQAANTSPEPCANAAAEGGVPLEAEINDADPLDVSVVNDPENPKIVVGGRWPNIVAFRKAIRHFAVTTGFEFADLVTDKTKFRARCKTEGCPWRIHASRIFYDKTIEAIIFHWCGNCLNIIIVLYASNVLFNLFV